MTEHEYLKVKDVADKLQVCTRTVFRYIDKGWLEATQLCPRGPWRITRKSVESLLRGEMK
jgi:predicted site-specific integrase-resolvase